MKNKIDVKKLRSIIMISEQNLSLIKEDNYYQLIFNYITLFITPEQFLNKVNLNSKLSKTKVKEFSRQKLR